MTLSSSDLLVILGAVALAAAGGELFLKGVLGVAAGLRVPNLVVATTLVAFATSSPELTVSTTSALSGKPEIGLGDALGSNVTNIALIFGLALLFGPLHIERHDLKRDFALALGVPLLTLWFVRDGVVSRGEGGLLLLVFALWLGFLIHATRTAAKMAPDGHIWRSLLLGTVGLAALVLAGRLFVTGATGIATTLGVNAYVIGATVVAIGTSLPELVTVLLSRLRGHDDVGVGTLLGSNLFNGLAIVGVAASIHPISAPPMEIAVALGMGITSLLLLIPGRSALIGRSRGLLLLAVYILFVATTLVTGRSY